MRGPRGGGDVDQIPGRGLGAPLGDDDALAGGVGQDVVAPGFEGRRRFDVRQRREVCVQASCERLGLVAIACQEQGAGVGHGQPFF